MKPKLQRTYSPKPTDITRSWFVVDATDLPLGRLASEVAQILRGKHKPTFAPHMDGGDHVIVVNADQVYVSGNKEIEKSRQYSDFQARHDELTGLPNRRYFLDYLEQTLGVAQAAGAAKAVLFVDLDNFKPVNDQLGHDRGDALLCKVALRLTSSQTHDASATPTAMPSIEVRTGVPQAPLYVYCSRIVLPCLIPIQPTLEFINSAIRHVQGRPRSWRCVTLAHHLLTCRVLKPQIVHVRPESTC